jgi:O-antigen/teichoic acid export membrane protein
VLAIPLWGYRASAVIHLFSEGVLLIAFLVLLRRDLPPLPWARLLWRPAVAGALMGVAGGLLYGVNVLLATAASLAVYALALWALGIAREPDMEVVRELIPGLEALRGLVPTRDG